MLFKLAVAMSLLFMASVNPVATALILILLVAYLAKVTRANAKPQWVGRLRVFWGVLALILILNLSFLGAGYLRHALGGEGGAPGDLVSFAPYGPGYKTYSWLGNGVLGRQYSRRDVRGIVERAFAARGAGGVTHLLAETGLRTGKNLHFHQSHKRGVAVDIHLPVRFMGDRSTLPSNVFTVWGYLWRFNDEGQSSALAWDLPKNCQQEPKLGLEVPTPALYEVDFDELARLLAAVVDEDRATRSTRLRYVILWRPYVRELKRNATYKELFGKKSKRKIQFDLMCAAPIHDEHIHLHFTG